MSFLLHKNNNIKTPRKTDNHNPISNYLSNYIQSITSRKTDKEYK